jgi:hypothetical protein
MTYTLHLSIRTRLQGGKFDDGKVRRFSPTTFPTFPALDAEAFDGIRPGADLLGDHGLPNGEWVEDWRVTMDHSIEHEDTMDTRHEAQEAGCWGCAKYVFDLDPRDDDYWRERYKYGFLTDESVECLV